MSDTIIHQGTCPGSKFQNKQNELSVTVLRDISGHICIHPQRLVEGMDRPKRLGKILVTELQDFQRILDQAVEVALAVHRKDLQDRMTRDNLSLKVVS